MFLLQKRNIHLLIVSFCIFIFLNLIENYIHYNIGRHREEEEFIKLSIPSKKDWIKIIIIMIIFAFLQGFFTITLNNYFT
jgi:hypothetical protein